jgi:hypothetical protein
MKPSGAATQITVGKHWPPGGPLGSGKGQSIDMDYQLVQ